MLKIRPPAERMLAKGVGRRVLSIRLAYWRLRYRLSQLVFDGQKIVAKVNPEEILTPAEILRRQEIGRRLEPLFAHAEEAYVRIPSGDTIADPDGAHHRSRTRGDRWQQEFFRPIDRRAGRLFGGSRAAEFRFRLLPHLKSAGGALAVRPFDRVKKDSRPRSTIRNFFPGSSWAAQTNTR